MHNTVISLEDITLQDLLTVDTHGEIINIQDRFAAVPYELISNRQIFFNEVFAEVENNGLCRVLDERKKEIDLTEFLDTLEKSKDSTVTLIEGFAGCGKSTLVQYILWNQLKTPNYDYYFYNYDLEAQNDIMIHDESGNVIRKSSIFEAIKKSYVEQFVHMVEMNKEIVKDIRLLLEKCEYFQPFNSLYYDLYNTDTFMEILKLIDESAVENNIIARNLFLQLGKITSSRNLLALDCILRLSMYNHKIIEKLYICYDNLDAIEDAEDLKNFDDVLIGFRGVIDRFIVYLQKGNYFRGVVPPHFNFIATYRKITAVIAKIADTAYREVMIDKNTEVDIDKVIFHIDATSAFSYKRIVNRRKDYFERYFKSALNISKETKKKLLADFASWDRLNQTLEIMNDRYACLWNKNYRTCSVIAGKLYSDSDYEFSQNVDFIEDSKVHDGYDHSEDEDGNSILCSYYGGSAILLSSVCKVFNKNEVWDDLLNLAPLNADEHSYKNVSFSRIILTYLYNKDEAVSLRELFTVFCGNELYDYTELCHILAKMLARNPKGVWRRPIYYSGEYILSEKSDEIAIKRYTCIMILIVFRE